MDKATATALNRRLLQNLKGKTTDSADGELSVPASAFCCPERLARERERLFRRVPQPVAFSAEIPGPGSYLALDVADVPVLLTRDEAGCLRAFINTCSHRGAQLASGAGTGGKLICPFHGWAYSLDGQLAGRPGDQYFSTSREDCALIPLPVSDKQGIVVIGIDPDLPRGQVDAVLDEVEPDFGCIDLHTHIALERQQFEVQANWKLVNDLSLESYHFATLHRDSVASVLASNAVVDTWQHTSRWAFPLKSIERLAELDENQWPDTLQGSCTYTLFPGVMIIVNETGAQMIRSEPGDAPGRSRVIYAGVRKAGSDPLAARQAYDFGGEVFAHEDLPVAEQCQRGLAAGRRGLLLGRNEPLLQFWHRLWADALG